ncbi:MAG: hypothetical protein ACLUUG_12050 [Lachnospiraceae bacterium]
MWKAVYLDDPRVFERKEEVEIPGFSVDILIDASSSRKQMQEQIAAQAYILSKSLKQCKIPVQIYSYCSIRGYTILHIFPNCKEEREDELFRYVAAGNNRDGLALRAAGHLMENGEKRKRILLVLTDASPQDDQDSGEGAFIKIKNTQICLQFKILQRSAESETKRNSGDRNFYGKCALWRSSRKDFWAKSDKDSKYQ